MKSKLERNNQVSQIRVTAPAMVTFDELHYKVESWNIEGFRISGFKQKAKLGDCLPINFSLKFQEGIHLSVDTLVEIIEFTVFTGKLEAKFIDLKNLDKLLLQQVIDTLSKGEITPVEFSDNENSFSSDRVVPIGKTDRSSSNILKITHPRFILFSFLYIAIGGVMGFYALRSFHDSLTQMEIKSAIVTKPVEPVISTNWGTLSKVYVREGMKVEAGQPLFRINDEGIARSRAEDEARRIDALNRDELGNINALSRNGIDTIDNLTEKIKLAHLEFAEAQADLKKAESLRQQEIEKLNSYKAIAQNKLSSARARVDALTVQYQAQKNQRDRFSSLLQSGAVSQQTFDAINSKFADIDAELKTARSELQTAQTAINSVQKGNFYDGNNLVSNLPRLTVDVQDARERVQLAAQKVNTLEQSLQNQQQDLQEIQKQKRNFQTLVTQKSNLPSSLSSLEKASEDNPSSVVYRAPFAGSVLKIVKSSGNTVKQSETLMVLQQEMVDPTVEAYLTQDEAAQILVGSSVIASVPELGKNYPARVTKIDRSGVLTDGVREPYQLQGSKDQSAYIKLVLSGVNREDKNQLVTGMPVVLKIRKKLTAIERLRF